MTKKYNYNGTLLSIAKIAELEDIAEKGLRTRLKRYPDLPITELVRFIKTARRGRISTLHTYQGQTKPLREWADSIGINICTLRERINRHGIDKAMKMGSKNAVHGSGTIHTYKGKARTAKEWSHHLGIEVSTFNVRLKRHGLKKAVEMGGPCIATPQKPFNRMKKAADVILPEYDQDLALKRRINHYQRQGLSIEQMQAQERKRAYP